MDKNVTDTMCLSLKENSLTIVMVMHQLLSSVPRCVLTSWSTAKHCCCRAQPRPSSASASSAHQAVSQLAGMEGAQVSDTVSILKKGGGI